MSQSPMDRFEDEWKAWARRPLRTGASDAARRLRERLEEPVRRRSPTRGWLAAAATVALAALGLWTSWPPGHAPDTPGTVGLVEPQPLPPGVVLIWLDVETPLYMTLTPPGSSETPAEKGKT